MTFANTLAATISVAPANHHDQIARLIWRGHASGSLTDDEAQAAAEALQGRRRQAIARYPGGPTNAWARLPVGRKVDCRSPDRRKSLERRRRHAASGPMPPGLACRFTTGRLAVMRIIADECRLRGRCDRSMGEIAARAGVCVRLAQLAIREAVQLGLLAVEARRLAAFYSETNVITVTSPEWKAWLAHKPRALPGENRFTPRSTSFYSGEQSEQRIATGRRGDYRDGVR